MPVPGRLHWTATEELTTIITDVDNGVEALQKALENLEGEPTAETEIVARPIGDEGEHGYKVSCMYATW